MLACEDASGALPAVNRLVRKLSLHFPSRFWLALVLWIQGLMVSVPARAESGCTGDANCTACENCHGCQHCGKQHGTCGVQQGLEITAEQRADAPFVGTWKVVSADGLSREETLQPDGSALVADEGTGRWAVTNGYLFVRFDDPASEQQTYDVSAGGKASVFSGQDQTGRTLMLQRRTGQSAPAALEPPATALASLSAPAGPTAPASPSAVQPAVPLSTCVSAIAAQSDPAKLGTLGSRATNPRLKRILYYLALARDGGADPAEVIEQAQRQNGSSGTPRAPLVKASLLRNLKICDGLGLLTPENRVSLRHGQAPVVTRGPYQGEPVHVDHIVPLAYAWDVDNELANLELLPRSLNCAKGAKIGDRQLDYARKFRAAGLITEANLINLQMRCKLGGTAKYELPEP